ncbi:excinuclease ABC subunit UvrA [Candidatus Nitronereus thalassa]|uniref:UvrABC system protein A n=1 Tax=Candidatus Nitronereus thalassa TaxID=3020898 RepID=A0ABU3KCM7_9BACT|nr:excinuclease ABC subunit UvrA [Candidatus Nitronereus thalassa]MDT7044264.1 excinuclease ABC subunit UvrA [Candidatus Nitronereus thalassa]
MKNGQDKDAIIIQGARQNNLRNVSVSIPHNAVTVVTGVSGSGKSSLAFDTLFAEGQWRFVESLSTYTRMFIERLDRPEVDHIENIRPAIAIEQKNSVRTARSTVGTATEISDHLRLLFSKIGRPICPKCQVEVRADLPDAIVDELLERYPQGRVMVLFPFSECKALPKSSIAEVLLQRGFVRVLVKDKVLSLDGSDSLPHRWPKQFFVILDRLVLRQDNRTRLMEAVEAAYREGDGQCRVAVIDGGSFQYNAEAQCRSCGYKAVPPRPVSFSYNHPLGACLECKGFGNVLQYDEALVVPDQTRSLMAGAIEPWTKPSAALWQHQLLRGAKRYGIDITMPYQKLSEEHRALIWKGAKGLKGVDQFFEALERKRYKMHVRVFLSRYRSPVQCLVCHGSRLKPEALHVTIHGMNIHEVSQLSIGQVSQWLNDLPISDFESSLTKDLIPRLQLKFDFLVRVGLEYLTLLRETRSLSGGEAQRIALANQLGAHLVGSLYVLDEPTIGLHARDTAMLATILRELAHRGNTIVVVEHDRQVIEQADHVIELGPLAGEQGGTIVCSAPRNEFLRHPDALTARFLRGDEQILIPQMRRPDSGQFIILHGAQENNLQHLTVRFPLGMLVCVTGVSGSGKSTLVAQTLYRAMARAFGLEFLPMGRFDKIEGLSQVSTVRMINQDPIGRTPRSNPITYMKGFQHIRQLFASTFDAKQRGLTASHFSFNSGLGRCQRCQGNGLEKLEMYFFEDLYVTCEACEGRRFNSDVLHVRWRGYSIHDILDLTVREAQQVFRGSSGALSRVLDLLIDLGLGYLRLGQSAPSLSGGEAQRLKMAAELATVNGTKKSGKVQSFSSQAKGVLYILDEPTTGLHLADVRNLLQVLEKLVDAGNSVIVVEHQLDVIKSADWVIDLGPGGGHQGGRIVAEGRPEDVMENEFSFTGKFLRKAVA